MSMSPETFMSIMFELGAFCIAFWLILAVLDAEITNFPFLVILIILLLVIMNYVTGTDLKGGGPYRVGDHIRFLTNFREIHLLSILIFTTAINILVFALYVHDKNAAENNLWRTPEKTLHIYMFFGGAIGAILGQVIMRHKTKKESFRNVFYLLLVIQLVIFVWIIGEITGLSSYLTAGR